MLRVIVLHVYEWNGDWRIRSENSVVPPVLTVIWTYLLHVSTQSEREVVISIRH